MASTVSERQIRAAFWVIFWLILIWLAAALYYVNIEFDDGYATISNSQHMLGLSEPYFWQRGPLVPLLLTPAELIANLLDLNPFNVRPHHAVFALLHLVYLAGVWKLLVQEFGARPTTLLAFVAAVPSLLFFSYAPFISHDIFPGLLTLLMVKLAHDYSLSPRWRTWVALVLIGALLALSKQTYALVWFAVLVTQGISAALWEANDRPAALRRLLYLAVAAFASGILTWMGYGLAPGGSFAAEPWWLRPWLQINGSAEHARKTGVGAFYPWLYFRNLSAYGVLAMTLLLPGLIFTFRGASRLAKQVAVTWLTLFVLLQVIEFKEVRYLGFLAPLTAFIIVAAIRALVQLRKSYAYLLLLIWCIDAQAIIGEAMRLRASYYRDAITDFLAPLPPARDLKAQVVVNLPLSFVSPERYAFNRDRYHRVSHVIVDVIQALYSYPYQHVGTLEVGEQLDPYRLPEATIVLFASDVANRRPPFQPHNSAFAKPGFYQLLGVTVPVTLRRNGDTYELIQAIGQPIVFLPAMGSQAPPSISEDRFPAKFLLATLGLDQAPEQLTLMGIRVERFCTERGCR